MSPDPAIATDEALYLEFVRALQLDLRGLLDHVRDADQRLRPTLDVPATGERTEPFDALAVALERAKETSSELVTHLENACEAAERMIEP